MYLISYTMGNGYKPAPLDTREIELGEKMMELVDLLAKNTHNVWAREKINRGWTYGVNEDPIHKRSPHLVPYEVVDARIKQANKDTAAETIRTLMLYGLYLDPPAVEHDEGLSVVMKNIGLHVSFPSYAISLSYRGH